MSILFNNGYRDEPYCEDHPKYQFKRRPTGSCKYCWRLWDDQQKREIADLKLHLVIERKVRRELGEAISAVLKDNVLKGQG